jgi:hypothetical protein
MYGNAKCEDKVQTNCRVITLGKNQEDGDFKADFNLPDIFGLPKRRLHSRFFR